MAYSPTGHILVTCADSTIHLWDPRSGVLLRAIHADAYGAPMRIAVSPNSRLLAVGGTNGLVELRSMATGHTHRVLRSPYSGDSRKRGVGFSHFSAVAISPDGRLLAAAFEMRDPDRSEALVWELASGRLKWQLDGHTGDVHSLAFSPDSRRLATGGNDESVVLWDMRTGGFLRRLDDHLDAVRAVAYSPDGRYLASFAEDGALHIREARTGAIVRRIKTRQTGGYEAQMLAFLPDSRTIAASDGWSDREGEAYSIHHVALWDVDRGARSGVIRDASSLAVSPDGASAAVSSRGNATRILRLADLKQQRLLPGRRVERITSVRFSPGGALLASASTIYGARNDDPQRGEVKLWDLRGGTLSRRLRDFRSEVSSLAFSPDGRMLATGSETRIKNEQAPRTRQERSSCGTPFGGPPCGPWSDIKVR